MNLKVCLILMKFTLKSLKILILFAPRVFQLELINVHPPPLAKLNSARLSDAIKLRDHVFKEFREHFGFGKEENRIYEALIASMTLSFFLSLHIILSLTNSIKKSFFYSLGITSTVIQN